MNTPVTASANARALQAIYDFIASAQVVSDYLESGDATALAQNLRLAKGDLEKPAQQLFKQMGDDDMELIDPDTDEFVPFATYEGDPTKYYLAAVDDNAYLGNGDPLLRYRDVLKSLYEAIQFSLVAVRDNLSEMNRDYCIVYAFILRQAIFFSNILRLILSTVGKPQAVVFIPDDYLARNPTYHITGMDDFDGLKKKFPIPFEGDLFFPNEAGDVPTGKMNVSQYGDGKAYSIKSPDDMNALANIYMEVSQKFVGGLS